MWFMNGSTVTGAAAINGATTWKALSTYTAGATPTTPVVTGISPSFGPVVTTKVTIAGINFGAMKGSSIVTLNGTAATVFESWSPGQIVAYVPAGAAAGLVAATVTGVQGLPDH